MEACFGYKGRAAVAFIQFAMAFGGMCAFAVILGDTIPRASISLAQVWLRTANQVLYVPFHTSTDVLTSILPGFAATGVGGWLLSRQVVTSKQRAYIQAVVWVY